MRISDWSSDVCSSDLAFAAPASSPLLSRAKPMFARTRDRIAAEADFPSPASKLMRRPSAVFGLPLFKRSRKLSTCSSKMRSISPRRSAEQTSELQSLMCIPYAVFCLKKKKQHPLNKSLHGHHP